MFGARDAKLGPDVIHAFKRDPRTAEWFPTQTWDFIDQHPEGLHQALMLYSDRGTPLSYRHQHFYACNTYRYCCIVVLYFLFFIYLFINPFYLPSLNNLTTPH